MTSFEAIETADYVLAALTGKRPVNAIENQQAAERLLWHATNLARHGQHEQARTFAALSAGYAALAAVPDRTPAGGAR